MAKRKRKVPAVEGKVGYCSPPVETQFKPGKSGNPGGGRTAGAHVREYINSMAQAGLDEAELRKEARNPKHPWARRTAAERMLRTLEAGDLSDFSGLLRGENSLEDLRGIGINTEVVKKFKQKTRVVPTGNGNVEEVIDREIELHDRAGADFDRILDRTDGKPKQGVEVTGRNGGAIQTETEHKHTIDYDDLGRQLDSLIAQRANRGVDPSDTRNAQEPVHSDSAEPAADAIPIAVDNT